MTLSTKGEGNLISGAVRHDRAIRERISVVGLGKLGAPLAACFAWRGFPTIAVDVDPGKVQAIIDARALVHEPGLQELLDASQGRLTATDDYTSAVAGSDVTFVVVPTPSEETGAFSLRDVVRALTEIGAALRTKPDFHLVVLVSTVMPGAITQELEPLLELHSGKTCGRDFGLCYSPEFIALGSVIRDLLQPDFILIGESDPRSGEMLANLYGGFCENVSPVARMNFINAELAKLAINAYLTTKISFANMLARLCERLPAGNVDVVTSAVGMDSRIGGKYLKGAVGYGGPCFPRDNLALAALARSVGAPGILAEATDAFNRQQVRWLADLVRSRLPKNGHAGILGLAYKPNSDVVEDAVGLLLAQALLSDGFSVTAYDPTAIPQAQEELRRWYRMDHERSTEHSCPAGMTFASSALACIRQADVVIVATPWDEFKQLTVADCVGDGHARTLIDCWRLLSHLWSSDQLAYLPLGISTGP
jgi:UDPglucose 6-dehydrogenase